MSEEKKVPETINEALSMYTAKDLTAEEANEYLKEMGASFSLVPGKNVLTDDDRKVTTVGYYPNQANGYGLLDTGTGTMDKVEVKNGKLLFDVNQVNEDGTTNMVAYVIICGKTYEVFGNTLGEVKEKPAGKVVQKDVDLSRREDLAGQVVRQTCRRGVFDVHYDEIGYAVKATKVKF